MEYAATDHANDVQFYQGLSVYGSKRKDWAAAGRDVGYVPHEERQSPLHVAAFEGSLNTLEWFLGDGPMRKYKEFIRNNQDIMYLKKLADAEGGVDKAVAAWLDARGTYLTSHGALSETDENQSAWHFMELSWRWS